MKKWFNFSKSKRLIVLGTTIFISLLGIILGSIFYLGKPGLVQTSSEYGNNSQFIVKISNSNGQKPSDIVQKVADDIKNRLDPNDSKGVTSVGEIYGDDASVKVTYPNATTVQQRNDIENEITHKPKMIVTDIYGNPLFTKNGTFNTALTGDPGKYIPFNNHATIEDLLYRNIGETQPVDSLVPIAENGASTVKNQMGNSVVKVALSSNTASAQWGLADHYLSGLPKGKNQAFIWLDPEVVYTKIYNFFKNDSTVMASKNNLNAFIRVGQKDTNALRKYTVDVAQYLISQNPLPKLSGNSFAIQGNFNQNYASQIMRKINYGISNYSLSSTVVLHNQGANYGRQAFKMLLIAGLVAFAIIALILIVNYGLLGALSTISLALFMFLTLLLFTIMRGEYSPASIAALVIGVGIAVDVIVVTFERLKTEIYAGSSLTKSFRLAQRRSLGTIFDSNLTMMIIAVILFYFGAHTIINLPVMLILSIIFTMIIMLILNRFLSTLLVNSNLIKNNKWLIGSKPKFDIKIQNKVNNINFVKNGKWFSMFSFVIMAAGFIVFAIFASINEDFASGFNLSQEFTGGISITAKVMDPNHSIDEIRRILESSPYDFDPSIIHIHGNELTVQTTKYFTDAQLLQLKNELSLISGNSFSVFRTTTHASKILVLDSIYAVLIAMAFASVYTFIRFKWTYAVAILLKMVHDLLIVLLVFIIARIKIEPVFVIGLLTITAYSINDSIKIFDRIKEKISNHIGELNKSNISNISNRAIREVWKRSFVMSTTLILVMITLMSFENATRLSYSLSVLVGIFATTYSSMFVVTWLWVKMETFRQSKIRSREQKGFWNVRGTEEQTIKGINDFVA